MVGTGERKMVEMGRRKVGEMGGKVGEMGGVAEDGWNGWAKGG
jgi:hypothetical protein